MKNILLLVHDDEGQESRYQVALDLVRSLDGHLTCLDITYVPPLIGSGYYESAYMVADLLTQETAREQTNKHRLQDRLAHEDVSWDWIDATGDIAPLLRHHAGCSDLIVVSKLLDEASPFNMRQVAGELIVRSGKPVVAVPADCKAFGFGHAVLAWNGSSSATSAMQAATPLMALAQAVTILEVEDEVGLPAEDAARYLSRHGIHACIKRVQPSRLPTPEPVLEAINSINPDFVVMGGFGHSRLKEALLGGVTRLMLDESRMPVLFAH